MKCRRSTVACLAIVVFRSHAYEEQGSCTSVGVPLSDNVLDRIAKPDAAADGIISGALANFCRHVIVLPIFRLPRRNGDDTCRGGAIRPGKPGVK